MIALSILISLGFLGFILSIKNPRYALFFLILCIPFQRYNYYLALIRFSLQPAIIVLAGILLGMCFRWKEYISIKFDKRIILLWIGIIAGECISLVNSINTFRTISVILFSLLTMSLVAVIYLIIKSAKIKLETIMRLVGLSGAVVSLLGIWQFISYLLGRNLLLPLERFFPGKVIEAEAFVYTVGSNSYLRPSSTFVDANLAGGFLGVSLFFNLSLLLTSLNDKTASLRKRLFALCLFVINSIAFLLTVSRSAYLGALLGGILFIIFFWKLILRKEILAVFICLAIATGSIVIFFDTPIEAMWGRVQTTFFEHDATGSTDEHLRFSNAAVDIFQKYPLTGIGAGNFEEYYLTNVDTNEDTAYTYNAYLTFAAETGVFGLFSQLAFLLYVAGIILKNAVGEMKQNSNPVIIVPFVGLCIYAIANLFYSYYILFPVWFIIALCIAFSLKIDKSNE